VIERTDPLGPAAVAHIRELRRFRELAVAMTLGVLIDAFVVRSLLAPALIAMFGEAGRWPRAEPSGEPGSGGTDSPEVL
jgi:uncharacterized membrane protein YdfJ with MMPL/SSD domain